MKVCIAGGREFTDYELLRNQCDLILTGKAVTHIVSGKQRGADTLGEDYAKERGYEVEPYPYESQFGKAGGPIRNRKMAMACDFAIIFWDGKSSGSQDMIKQMIRVKKPYKIVSY